MENTEKFLEKRSEKYAIGMTVFIILVVLTIGEFLLVEVGANWVNILLLTASVKAFLVVREFMHIGRLFQSDEEH